MLLSYGNTTCSADWRIDEKIPAGYCRVYHVLSGSVQYQSDRQCAALRHGYLYIFPSSAPYRMRQRVEDPLRCTFIHLQVSPAQVPSLIECPVTGSGFLQHFLLALSAAIDTTDRALVGALAEVLELYMFEHGIITPPDHSLSQVLLYIHEHIAEPIPVSRLSAIAGYNDQYFIRLFHKGIGITPYQYIISHRLNESKKLLNQNISVSQAAEMTGYRDLKSFSRAFRKTFGMSPSAFRKNHPVFP